MSIFVDPRKLKSISSGLSEPRVVSRSYEDIYEHERKLKEKEAETERLKKLDDAQKEAQEIASFLEDSFNSKKGGRL